ncbi:MAG: SH3 domain-containing protein [Chloroflexi bacterium]|nr:SH3 domain-containing protein [Chloroflexota bacterium]
MLMLADWRGDLASGDTGRAVRVRRPLFIRPVLVLALLSTLLLAALAFPRPAGAEGPFEEGQQVVVSADGDCLNLRAGATVAASRITCVPDGTVLTALGAQREADGYVWERVSYHGRAGWMASAYLAALDDDGDDAEDTTPAVPEVPTVFAVPPPGGFTAGPVGTTDLDALVEAQSFEVASVWYFRAATQDYASYIPGAPAIVNTLDASTLTPGSIVLVSRRAGEEGEPVDPAAATDDPVTGEANVLPVPPANGLTIGVSGTNDPATLAAAQPFEVRLIVMLDVPSQQWLTYVPGAPDIVQTLGRGQLQPDSVVWMRAGMVSSVVETVEVTLSYYYCRQGTIAASIGDGGGWCGAMANGEVVHQGAAACARSRLGERFRIIGDPLGLTYECEDTGSAVHGHHRDIFFDLSDDGYRWIVEVGYTAVIEILDE